MLICHPLFMASLMKVDSKATAHAPVHASALWHSLVAMQPSQKAPFILGAVSQLPISDVSGLASVVTWRCQTANELDKLYSRVLGAALACSTKHLRLIVCHALCPP